MMASRVSSDSPGQAEISATVRPQPMQSRLSGSTTQVFMQGVKGAGGTKFMRRDLSAAPADEKGAKRRDFARLSRCAGDVAGLAADLTPRER